MVDVKITDTARVYGAKRDEMQGHQRQGSRRGDRATLVVALGVTLAVITFAAPSYAQSPAVRVLRDNPDFRARVRAAMVLGAAGNTANTPHLIRALSDSNGAVRAAAASALGRLGDAAALESLRGLRDDSEAPVRREAHRAMTRIREAQAAAQPPQTPSHTARAIPRRSSGEAVYPTVEVVPREREIRWSTIQYVIVLGSMENRSNFESSELATRLMSEVSRGLIVLRGVAVLEAGNISAHTEREIRRRRIPKLRLEGAVSEVQRTSRQRELAVRVEVRLMLLDEASRAIRSEMTGAATGVQPQRGRRAAQETALAQQALTGAVRSAMSGAATAIASAGRR